MADLWGFVKAGPQRERIVLSMMEGPRTPTELARAAGLHLPNVSRVLTKLCDAEVAYCLTPERRKGRVYGLTPEAVVRLWVKDRAPEFRAPDPTPSPEVRFAPRVRGEAMIAGVTAAAEVLGVDRLLTLCHACGYNFLGIERERWYSMDLHHAFLHRLYDLFDTPEAPLCREVGRRSIPHLRFLQRFLHRRDIGLLALIERAPLVHGRYFNFGRFEVEPVSDGVLIRQFDMLPTPPFCAARLGNYEGVMEARGVDARLDEVRCETRGDDHCAFGIGVKGPSSA